MMITGRYNGYPQAIDLDKITRVYVNDHGYISVCGLSGGPDYLFGIWVINGIELEAGDAEHKIKIMEFIVNYLATAK